MLCAFSGRGARRRTALASTAGSVQGSIATARLEPVSIYPLRLTSQSKSQAIRWLVSFTFEEIFMRSDSLLSRGAMALTLITVLAVGMTSFVPSAFGCGTNAGGGNCKQASHKPVTTIGAWSVVEAVLTGLRIYVRL
jgi:hypothetical protein